MSARRALARIVIVLPAALALLAPGIAAQSRSRDAGTLIQEAVAALDADRYGEALDTFTQAATALPRDPGSRFGAGVAAFMLGRNAEAQAWFEQALALDPRYTAASEWLGELHYRAGRVRSAIDVYETAMTHAPKAAKLAARLDEWKKESTHQSSLYESRGAHFSVLFEGPSDEALARRTVERLEEAYWRIGQALTAYPPQPITVVLYTREQFRNITRMPSWSAAAYDGRIHVPMRGALEQTEELDRVLGHEFVHAVVAMLAGRNVPVWLNEGLATTLERNGDAEAQGVLARTSARPPLHRLHGTFNRLSADDAEVAYAMGARAVRRMIELRSASAVVTLLQDLGRGAVFATAFHQNIGMTYDDFQAMIARE